MTTKTAPATPATVAPKADVRDRLAAEMDSALGKGKSSADLLGDALKQSRTERDSAMKAQRVAKVAKAASDASETETVETLTAAFKTAESIMSNALVTANVQRCFMARAAFRIFTHPTVGRKYATAAKVAGVARNTFRTYIDAGIAMDAWGDALATGEPSDKSVAYMTKLFGDAAKKAKDARDAAKAETVERSTVAADSTDDAGISAATPPSEADALTGSQVVSAAIALANMVKVFSANGGKFTPAEQARLETRLAEIAASIAE